MTLYIITWFIQTILLINIGLCDSTNSTVIVRLVPSKMSPQGGRLEVFYNGIWGTVCNDDFDERDAKVVCRMLGIETNHSKVGSFGRGSGPILLDDLNCTGLETNIAQCSSRGWGIHNCEHVHDVGVLCISEDDANVQVRLVNGSSATNGRLEVFYKNTWGTVCDDSFNALDADVVCRMLGFTSYSGTSAHGLFGQGTGPILLDDVHCFGMEQNIAYCTHNGWYVNNCHHSEDVGVFCDSDSDVNTTIQIRLVNGSSATSGRLEVSYQNVWGRVCDESFNLYDAMVVCRMLGFQTVSPRLVTGGTFGSGSGQIMLKLLCSGSETSIVQCGRDKSFVNDCTHGDVGVICDEIEVQIRLVNDSSTSYGRLEVFYKNTWLTVCDDHFDAEDVRVVCRMLGMPHNNSYLSWTKSFYGTGLTGLWCTGLEISLEECAYNNWQATSCGYWEPTPRVICDLGLFAQDFHQLASYRLMGPREGEGRLEINIGGIWGTVCDDLFDDKAAKVVCDALGIQHVQARMGSFGSGSGPIWLDNVLCYGNERSLAECNHNGWGVSNCDHSEDVGVICGTSSAIIG